MKKLLSIIAGFAVAVVAIAAVNTVSPVSATSCTEGTKYTDFDGTRNNTVDTLTVWTKDNKPLCNDVKVNFSSYTIHNKYNGQGFKNNPTALPQSQFYNKTVTLKKGTNGKTTVTVQVPDACTDYQIDAYIGPVQTKITTSEGLVGTNAIVGKVFQRTKTTCTVKVCNPATGQIITVAESEASKYKPVGDIACKPPVKVCNPANGQIITVPAKDASKYKPVGDVACKPKNPEKVKVCNPANGQIIEVDKADASKYKPIDDAACVETPPEVLPSTGPTEAISALFGVGSLAGAGTAYIRSRRALRK